AARYPSACSGDRRSPGFDPQGKSDAREDECAEQDRRRQRKTPPEAEPHVDGDKERGESRAAPEQRVQDEDRSLDRRRMEPGSQRIQRRNGEPEARTEEGGRDEQERKGDRSVCLEELADEEKQHRTQAAEETPDVDLL